MSEVTVKADRDLRLTYGGHVILLKKGSNKLPLDLARALSDKPGVTFTDPSAKSSEGQGAQSK